jgi:WD40 repeat protein
MTTVAKLVINEENPWPGLDAFDEASERFFNGRTNESAELRRLVLHAPLTVLFGASGLGKTSLVQAGLFPLLRKDHLLPVYVRLDLRDQDAPLMEQVKLALKDQIHARGIDAPALNSDECLWQYLHRAGLELWSEHNQLLMPLLVFDQFEEVFTLGVDNPAAVVRLRTDLADLIENRLPAGLAQALQENEAVGADLSLDSQRYKVLLSFREDFLPAAEGWKREVPSILRNRLRLLPMTGEQAFEAIHTTAAHLVEEQLARRIVRFVAAAKDEETGRAVKVLGSATELAVEPALLSIVCHGLNEKRKVQGKAAFDEALLSGAGQAIISDYYRHAVGDLPERVQRFIEEELITERGFRKPCDVDDARSVHGVTDHELRLLVDRRLLRIEPQRGTDRVELTHDLLTRVVREHRDRQRERERMRRQRRRMAILGAGGVLLAGLVLVFFLLYRTAEHETQLATSRQLAAQAQVGADLGLRAPRNLLLALESVWITQQIGAFSPTASRQLLNVVLNATGGLPLRHADPVTAVGLSPDDRWLATASAGNVQLWDMRVPFATPITLRGNDKVNALAFSPDGRTLASVGDDAKLRLWDTLAADRAASMRVLTGHRDAIVDVAFSRDGRWLATGSKDGTAWLWDFAAAGPATAGAILRNEPDVNTLAFSPDNHWLATGSSDGAVRLWDLLSPKLSNEPIQLNIGMDVRKVAFSPNSQWVVAGDTESYKVVLIRVATPDKRFVLKVFQWVEAVAFSPDSRWLATPSGYDARLWDLNKADPSSEPLILGGHKYFIADLAFSPDGNWFATGSLDHTVQLWNVGNGFTAPAVLGGHEGPITALVFSHDSRQLITASIDRTVRLWNTSSPHAEPLALRIPGTADGSTELHLWDMRAVDSPALPRVLGRLDSGAGSVFSPDGQWIATIPAGDNVDFVHLWNLSTPSPTHYLVRHEGRIWAAPVFSPDGRWLAIGGVIDPTIRLWDLKKSDPTSRPQVLRGHRGPVRSLAFSADGHRLATGARDGLAIVWDLTAADPSVSRKGFAGGDIKAVAISADGRYLATGSWEPDNAARIWDLSSPVSSSPISTLTFEGRVFDVAFSPDGRWVAAGSWDSTTQLLNLKKQGTKPFVLRGHAARTLSVAFSPDSQWLATGNEDQTGRLWNLTVADPSADSTVLQATYKVGNVSFSPDGRWLALNPTEYRSSPFSRDGHWFASSATNTLLYHLRLEDLILVACRTAGRNLTKSEWELSLGDQPYRKICP